jgi:hypothetical protein
MSSSSTCINCESALEADDVFCRKCGQQTHTHRLSFGHLVHDIIHYFTHADKSIFRLIWLLLKQPGITVREYLHGKRKKYFPPVNFFLIAVAIMAISVRVFKTFNMDFMMRATRDGVIQPSQSGAQVVLEFVSSQINWIYIGFIPVFTFLFWIFYTKRKYNYIEHLVAGLYWNGIIVLFLALVISPLIFVFNSLDSYYFLSLTFMGALTLYYAVAYYRMLEYASFWKFVKSLAISLAVTFVSFLIFVFLIGTYYYITA